MAVPPSSVPTTGAAAFLYGADGLAINTDGSGRVLVAASGTGTGATQVQGTAAAAAAISGNPVQVGGSDGTNARALLVDTGGRALVKVTDGTNFMPTMDTVGRRGFVTVTDGTNSMPTMDSIGRPGFNKITDGTNVAAVNAGLQQLVNTEGQKTTYSAQCQGINPGASATNLLSLAGSGTKTIRILRVEFSGTQTTGGSIDILLGMFSSAFTGGTPTTVTAVPHDRNNVAATAVASRWTAPPTGGGVLVGYVRAIKAWVGVATTVNVSPYVWDFTTRNGQGLVLRGTGDIFAIQLAALTVTGASLNASIEWTEE